MVRGFKVMILGLCITAVGISGADAQQKPPGINPNIAQIRQLSQELRGLRKKLDSVYSKMQQLMVQVKALREQALPLQEKLDVDSEKLRTLVGK
jgi:FtsZ-binding cell division protein ZapB